MVGRPARRPDRTTAVNSGRRRRRACAGNTSGGELLAALATTAGEDCAACTGAHPQPEAVGLGPTTVVRLERALAHEELLRLRLRMEAGADGAAPRTRRLVSADRPHRSAGLPVRSALRGRQGPSTDPPSIAEDGPLPVAGTRAVPRIDPTGSWRAAAIVTDPPCSGTARSGCTQARRRTTRATRRDGPRRRCPAVDGAVSVAVAPRRTPGFRRRGRPRRSTDRRAPVVHP
jgi:hypothetical protein